MHPPPPPYPQSGRLERDSHGNQLQVERRKKTKLSALGVFAERF